MKRTLWSAVLAGLLVGSLMAVFGGASAATKKETKSEWVAQGVLYTEPKEGSKNFDGMKAKMVFQKKKDGKWRNYGTAKIDKYNGFSGENGGVAYWEGNYPKTEGSECRMLGKGPIDNDTWAPSKATLPVKCSTGEAK